jgi:hypothetical protein
MYDSTPNFQDRTEHTTVMKPNFTDGHRYPRGYVRSESTDITKTWTTARGKLEQDKQAESNARRLKPYQEA